jgi:hypothetical protein
MAAVASLIQDDLNVLVQLSDAVSLGRSQSRRALAKVPKKASVTLYL